MNVLVLHADGHWGMLGDGYEHRSACNPEDCRQVVPLNEYQFAVAKVRETHNEESCCYCDSGEPDRCGIMAWVQWHDAPARSRPDDTTATGKEGIDG